MLFCYPSWVAKTVQLSRHRSDLCRWRRDLSRHLGVVYAPRVANANCACRLVSNAIESARIPTDSTTAAIGHAKRRQRVKTITAVWPFAALRRSCCQYEEIRLCQICLQLVSI